MLGGLLCYRIEQLVHLPGLRREASSLAAKLMAVLQPVVAHKGHPLFASVQAYEDQTCVPFMSTQPPVRQQADCWMPCQALYRCCFC